MRRRELFTAMVMMLAAGAAQAQPVLQEPSCLPERDNGVVRATAEPGAPGSRLRLYFRAKGEDEAWYWVEMEPEGPGRFWATPPKPEKRTTAVELYAALADAAGQLTARSETRTVKVTGDCRVNLSAREAGVADNLTVGETDAEQEGDSVLGFLCDGIVTRINPQGIRRADEACRACVVAWWQKKSFLIPTLLGTTVIVSDDPEPSPSRPR